MTELHTWEWLAILVARLAVGLLFFLSGRSKLFVPEGREQMCQTLLEPHVPFPEFNALFVSTVEFVFGRTDTYCVRDAWWCDDRSYRDHRA
jgi:putative oxidoreductase